MLIRIALATAILVASTASADDRAAQNQWTPPPPKEGFRYPDCFCTDSQGQRIELGKTSCLQIGSRQVLAKCSMSLNNPTWRPVSEGCPNV